MCSNSGPGVCECDATSRSIAGLADITDNLTTPHSANKSYLECLKAVKEGTTKLNENVTEIPTKAQSGDMESVGALAIDSGKKVSDVTEAAMHAAYLIGASDPSSTPAKPGVIDQSKVQQKVFAAAENVNLMMSVSEPGTIVNAAAELKNIAQDLCTMCNTASAATSDPATKQAFMESRKNIAGTMRNERLFFKIKAYATDDAHRDECQQACDKLLEAMNDMSSLSNNASFAPVPAVISDEGAARPKPVSDATKG